MSREGRGGLTRLGGRDAEGRARAARRLGPGVVDDAAQRCAGLALPAAL